MVLVIVILRMTVYRIVPVPGVELISLIVLEHVIAIVQMTHLWMNAVYVKAITVPVLIVPAFLMEPTGQVIAGVLQIITLVMIVMIVQEHLMVIAGKVIVGV